MKSTPLKYDTYFKVYLEKNFEKFFNTRSHMITISKNRIFKNFVRQLRVTLLP